jgi:hypothetical protein
VLLILAVLGCGTTTPSGQESGSPAVVGAPVDPGVKPSPTECDRILRADVQAAIRIRESLQVAGVPSSVAAAQAAAADPEADLSAFGVPFLGTELHAIRDSGLVLDAATALAYWVSVGAPERFGGIWMDPPASGRYVVSIVGPDEDTLRLARCLEQADTRYVVAGLSLAAGNALKDRIAADSRSLEAEGIRVTLVDFDETRGVVVIGVMGLTEGIRRALSARYGPWVRVEEQPLVVPM